MSGYLDRARLYHQGIRDILLRDWDPIGVSHIPEAEEEYDSYVGEIYALLIRHEPKHRLIDHLWWIETQQMGRFGSRWRTEKAPDKLIQFRDQIEAQDQ